MIGTIITILLLPLIVAGAGLVGYFLGVTIAIIPGIDGILTDGLGLENQAIPTIMAWLFIYFLIRIFFTANTPGVDKDA